MNLSKICESESSNLYQIKDQIKNELRVHTFAIVTSVDIEKKTLCARPIVKERIRTKSGISKALALPEIKEIPYMITHKSPKKDDYCVLLHLDRSIKDLNINNTYDNREIVSNKNRHALDDVVAVVGFGFGESGSDDSAEDYNLLGNKPKLDTTSEDSLKGILEVVEGTVKLHKISKTGSYNDLVDKPVVATKTSELTNDGDGKSKFATESYVTEKGGKIASISLNGTTLAIDDDKNVNIVISANSIGAASANDIEILNINKVDKVEGKGLSTNDFTNSEKEKLATLKNYDDTEIKQSVLNLENTKASRTEISKFITTSVDNLENYYLKDLIFTKTEINELIKNFITNTVDNLVNYYKKSETYTQEEVNALVSAIPKFAIQVVDTLPTSNISASTVYLVKPEKTDSENLYEEYIYVNNGWEKLGTQKVDLSGYLTIEAFNTAISNYYNKTNVEELLAKKQNTINSENPLSSVFIDTSNTPNRQFVTSAEKEIWNEKQAKIDSSNMLSANFISDNFMKRFVTDTEKEQWNLAEKNVQSDWEETDDNSDAFIKNKPKLAAVATSNSYKDLYDKPTIPVVDYPVTSVNGKTKEVQLSASDVGALADTTLYGATLSGEQNGVENSITITLKDQKGKELKSLTYKVPYSTSALQNDSGFITIADVNSVLGNYLPSSTKYATSLTGTKYFAENRITIQLKAQDGTYLGNSLGFDVPYHTSALTNDSDFTTNATVNSLLTKYYLKTETYTKSEVNDLISALEKITIELVTSLPEIGDSNVIYFVPSTNGSQDNYDEYIYLSSKGWEKIGNTDIDLGKYSTTEQMNAAITTAIANAVANLVVNTIKINGKPLTADITLTASDVGALSVNTPLFSGDYNDLSNKPTIPKTVSELSDSGDYAKSKDLPNKYLTDATVSDNKLTITKNDGTSLQFEGGGGGGTKIIWRKLT